MVVPYQEPAYYAARPTIAIAPPGKDNGSLDLDGQFGLHPALSALMPQWQAGHLAFVHAAGSAVLSRSHFQAQDYLESGTPGTTTHIGGWLNRLLAFLPAGTPTQAVNMGGTLPLIFSGAETVASLAVEAAANQPLPIDQPQIQAAFDQLYAGDSQLAQMYQEGRMARELLLRELNAENMAASRGAPAPAQLVTTARYLARLMRGDANTQVAFLDLGEWDTHVNQHNTLNYHLNALANGLVTLATELGPVYEQTTLVVMSEFGRSVAENGNGGTDHGYGNGLWVMGGRLQGKQFYGEWPGLDPAVQHESRDLAVTTDFRDVFSALLSQQFGLGQAALGQIFPGYQPKKHFQFLL